MENKDLKPDFQKTIKNGHPYPILNHFRVERYITRPLSSLIVRSVFRTPITPNHLTYASFFVAMAGSLFFCGGSHLYFILGGLFSYLSSIFDCADGMLARARDECTHFGTYLDLFLDRIADFFIFCGILIGYFRHSKNHTLFIAGSIGLGLYFLQVSLYYLIMAYKRKPKTGQASEARGLTLFAIMGMALINRLEVFIYGGLLFCILSVLFKLFSFIRMGHNDNRFNNT